MDNGQWTTANIISYYEEYTGLNIVVGWLTILLLTREVRDSNFGPKLGYVEWRFSWFASVPQGNLEEYLVHTASYLSPSKVIFTRPYEV
jgi:hypothetical protein